MPWPAAPPLDVPAAAPWSGAFVLVAALESPIFDAFPVGLMLPGGEVPLEVAAAGSEPGAADVESAALARPAPIMPIAGTIRPTINLRLK